MHTPMKKLIQKPGFETIFALGLMVILGLPPVLLAQNTQEVEIKIENGDTLVNGKSIKELSARERMVVQKDIKNIAQGTPEKIADVKNDSTNQVFVFKKVDSIGNHKQKIDFKNYQFNKPNGFDKNNFPLSRVPKRNMQNYDFVHVDNEGFTTRLRFTVTDVSNEDLKKMPYVQGPKFEVEDLVLVPEFTSGTILMTFHLHSKIPADVKFVNSEGETIWDAKTNGEHFSKSFTLGLNGIYFLQIIQGKSVAAKRIVKEG